MNSRKYPHRSDLAAARPSTSSVILPVHVQSCALDLLSTMLSEPTLGRAMPQLPRKHPRHSMTHWRNHRLDRQVAGQLVHPRILDRDKHRQVIRNTNRCTQFDIIPQGLSQCSKLVWLSGATDKGNGPPLTRLLNILAFCEYLEACELPDNTVVSLHDLPMQHKYFTRS